MSGHTNALGQPVGFPVPDWSPRPRPPRTPLVGQHCRVEPLAPRHAAALHAANCQDRDGALWTYLPYGPFDTPAAYAAWLETAAGRDDPLFHAIVDSGTDHAVGVASYLRITPEHGTIEVGHINYAPALQRTVAATEAMFLMMARAFDALGYRRYEWKCNALNAASRRAAERQGFRFEGIFRQAIVTKGRNRDTAWYAIVDADWPAIKTAFERWLAPANFDNAGRQRAALTSLMPAL